MRLRLSRHLRYLAATSIALISTVSVLIGTTGMPLGTSAACGCETKETLPRLVNAKGEQPPAAFSLRSGEGLLESTLRNLVACTSDEIRNMRLFRDSVNRGEAPSLVLRGCQRDREGCNTVGANAEEVVTGRVEFILGFTSSPPDTGLVIQPPGNRGDLVTIECNRGRQRFTIYAGAVGRLTPTDRKTRTLTAEFNEKEGVDELTEYLNEDEEKVKEVFEAEGEGEEAFALKEIGFSSTEELAFEEEVEIKT
jgi:hypothetical protein